MFCFPGKIYRVVQSQTVEFYAKDLGLELWKKSAKLTI
jgi:hypothetical protein